MSDADLRAKERAWRASPEILELAIAYDTAARRHGITSEPRQALLARLVSVLRCDVIVNMQRIRVGPCQHHPDAHIAISIAHVQGFTPYRSVYCVTRGLSIRLAELRFDPPYTSNFTTILGLVGLARGIGAAPHERGHTPAFATAIPGNYVMAFNSPYQLGYDLATNAVMPTVSGRRPTHPVDAEHRL
jgi:hypothetical protein